MKNSKKLLTLLPGYTIIYLASRMRHKQHGRNNIAFGVWLSLARALDLGSRGRRFESCHPECNEQDRTVRESRSVLPERLEFNRVINGDTVKLERSQYFSIKKEFPRT